MLRTKVNFSSDTMQARKQWKNIKWENIPGIKNKYVYKYAHTHKICVCMWHVYTHTKSFT